MKMTEEALLRYLDAESDAARAFYDGSDQDRTNALRAYLRKPYGNELPGRAQVVSSDVFDAVEGVLPELLEVFIASDKAVVFDPVSEDDEEGAKQATAACNYVFYKQNNGFKILYDAAKDGLMYRVGAIKWYWDVRRTPEFFTVRTADEMQLAVYLATNPKAEVVSQEPYEPEPEEVQQAQAQGLVIPPRFTVRIKTVKERGTVKLCVIPPDELEVSTRHDSILLDDCPYVCHKREVTLSDIRQMGYRVTIEDLKGATDGANSDSFRDELLENRRFEDGSDEDESMLRGWLREEYVLVDFDGDGIAERRKVMRLGQKMLENVEFSHVPMAAWTPFMMPHRFEGLSQFDLTEDFQKVGTDIWRAQLDNLDLANNQETVVLTDANGNVKANIDDLLNRRPGGILREQFQGAIRPYNERWQGIEAMPMIDMHERAKQARTGFVPVVEGMDADALSKTATQVSKESNRSQKRMKLTARTMPECLVAPTFRGIFKTLTDYCMEKLSFKLHGQYVKMDPQEWRDQYNLTINVGIGTGDHVQQAMMLQSITQAQFALMQSPFGYLVQPQNIYASLTRQAENAGFKNPGEFYSDPKTVQAPQPQPDPKTALEQMKLQADAQKFQAQMQMDAHKFKAEAQMRMQVDASKQEYEARQKQMEIEQQAQLEVVKAQAGERVRLEELAMERWKAELDAQVKLAIASKPEASVSALQEQITSLVESASATPEILRDVEGRAVGVKRGAKVYGIKRGDADEVMGLEEMPDAAETV
jgi:hypothetical protein